MLVCSVKIQDDSIQQICHLKLLDRMEIVLNVITLIVPYWLKETAIKAKIS